MFVLKNFIADSGKLVNQRIVRNSVEISFEIIEDTQLFSDFLQVTRITEMLQKLVYCINMLSRIVDSSSWQMTASFLSLPHTRSSRALNSLLMRVISTVVSYLLWLIIADTANIYQTKFPELQSACESVKKALYLI